MRYSTLVALCYVQRSAFLLIVSVVLFFPTIFRFNCVYLWKLKAQYSLSCCYCVFFIILMEINNSIMSLTRYPFCGTRLETSKQVLFIAVSTKTKPLQKPTWEHIHTVHRKYARYNTTPNTRIATQHLLAH